MKKLKKKIFVGVIIGCLLSPGIIAGAMSTEVTGKLHYKNPLLTAPQGYAYTMGFKTITAKVTVSKSGHTTKSTSASKNAGSIGDSVKTNWLKGPTLKSAGTTFKSNHTGYSNSGSYQTLSASYKY